jgi:hypothetical protein
MDEPATVYVDGRYDDRKDEPQPWVRPRREGDKRPRVA